MMLAAAISFVSHVKMRFLMGLVHGSNTIATNNISITTLEHKLLESQASSYPSSFARRIDVLCRDGRLKEAVDILHLMYHRSIPLDSYSYSSILQACADMRALSEGKQVHSHIHTSGLEQNIFLETKLVSMYAICGSLDDARLVFDKIPRRNVFLWNAMISGYAKNDLCEQAINLYSQMQRSGIRPDNFTFPCALKVCANLLYLKQGKEIHNHVITSGFESDVVVKNAIVGMYAKCGNIEIARQVFDKMSHKNVSSWNTIIAGYAQNGHADETLRLLRQMQLEGMKLDPITIVSVLPLCSYFENPQQGKEVHNFVIRNGFDSDVFVSSALIDMYIKCRRMEFAHHVFDKMSHRNVVSWTSMIAGCAQNGHANEALKLFRQMQMEDVEPNRVTIVSVLPACAHLAALQQGKEIHKFVIKNKLELDVSIGNALLDMYAKCGSIEIARQVFDKVHNRDVVSWSAMIAGYGMHGQGEDALSLFYQMQRECIEPDHITFIGVLSACSHTGLVDEGWQFFNCMQKNYGFSPMVEHYACMVDLLGRAGQLDRAQEFIERMPLEPSASVWGALLGACRVHCNIELGECVSEWLFELEPENVGNYVLLSNIYAAVGQWDGVTKVRMMMKERGLKKVPGCSWIVIEKKVHAFLAGDKSHPQSKEINAEVENISWLMKDAGYVPDFHFVLHDV
eukprot:Gb_21442 [translate_table: standard]